MNEAAASRSKRTGPPVCRQTQRREQRMNQATGSLPPDDVIFAGQIEYDVTVGLLE